jgi:hypothetical protein
MTRLWNAVISPEHYNDSRNIMECCALASYNDQTLADIMEWCASLISPEHYNDQTLADIMECCASLISQCLHNYGTLQRDNRVRTYL